MGRGAAFVMYMPLWQAACTGQDVEEFESLYDEGKKNNERDGYLRLGLHIIYDPNHYLIFFLIFADSSYMLDPRISFEIK